MSKVAHNFQEKSRTGDVIISESVNFNNLLLSEPVLNGLKNAGFIRPSPIQLKAIPLGRCGLDLIVQAKSGTGKTCVFSVISLESIVTETASTQVLVLAPTREIAVQIWDVICSIGSAINGLQCHTFIGGMPLHEDRMKLRKCHIAVGSPGRIKQLIECGALHTGSIRLFILDEADKLLEDSFQEQINWIYSSLPENKQMLALSATYPEYLAQHLIAYMRNPTFLRLNISDPALLGIRQYYQAVTYHPMSHVVFEEKTKVLFNILSSISFQQCLVFSNLQSRAQTLADLLTKSGWPTSCIAGRLDQTERNNAMAQLKTYKCRVLISTDLTSRGIDADKVNLVINMDLPKDHETYLHRIGRAGRFGSFGIAITLISEGQERLNMNSIEKKCNTQINLLPDPIPNDLAKPDCPILLDDVVSSEVICTEKNKLSLTNKHTSDHEARADSKTDSKNNTGVISLDSSSNIERFPYQLVPGTTTGVENCLAQSDNKSGDESLSSLNEDDDKTIRVTETSDTYVRNGDCANDKSCVNNDDKGMNKEMFDASDFGRKLTGIPLSQEENNLNESKPSGNDTRNERIESDFDRLAGKHHKMVESIHNPELVNGDHFKSRDKHFDRSEYNVDTDMEVPFQLLRNLNISDIIKHNIGYKTLPKFHSYNTAVESMKEYKSRRSEMSENGADICDRLKTFCSVNSPGTEHPDTDTLRKTISAVRNIHECSLSQNRLGQKGLGQNGVSQNIPRLDSCRNIPGDGVSSNIDSLVCDDKRARGEIQDETKQAKDAEVTVLNEPISTSYAVPNAAEPVECLDQEQVLVLPQCNSFSDNVKVEPKDATDLTFESVTVCEPKPRKKRFGYLGSFSIGHLLEQERAKDTNQNKTEQINEVDYEKLTVHSSGNTEPNNVDNNLHTFGTVRDSDPDIVENILDTFDSTSTLKLDVKENILYTVENEVDLDKDIDSNYSDDSIEEIVDLKKYSRGSTKPEENFFIVKEASNVESKKIHSSHQSNLLTSFKYIPYKESGEAERSKPVLEGLNERIAVNNVKLEKDRFENISDSEDLSSSEISESETDLSSEDSIENGGVDKSDRKVRNRISSNSSRSHSRTQRSDYSDTRSHDSGVYSRPSYHDYWYQCYNDWYASYMSQHPGWNPYTQSYTPFFNGNQSNYPSCNYGSQLPYHEYQATNYPYPPYFNPYNQVGYSQASNWSYPFHKQTTSRNSPRSTAPSRSPTSHGGSSPANCMSDIYQFQNDYIKQMCEFNNSRKHRERFNEQ